MNIHPGRFTGEPTLSVKTAPKIKLYRKLVLFSGKCKSKIAVCAVKPAYFTETVPAGGADLNQGFWSTRTSES
ncbi:MAG: hypothetical protein WD045_07025 [Pirellulaceae bacterium]